MDAEEGVLVPVSELQPSLVDELGVVDMGLRGSDDILLDITARAAVYSVAGRSSAPARSRSGCAFWLGVVL